MLLLNLASDVNISTLQRHVQKVALAQRMYMGYLSDMEFWGPLRYHYYSNLFCYV
jgi:hypothetical protein